MFYFASNKPLTVHIHTTFLDYRPSLFQVIKTQDMTTHCTQNIWYNTMDKLGERI